jgi:hypothetical protein
MSLVRGSRVCRIVAFEEHVGLCPSVESPPGGAVAPGLHRMLRRLEGIWAEQGMPVVDHLAPGISPDELVARLAPLGLEPPHELSTWFEWHNGLAEDAMSVPRRHAEIVPAGLPLSLHEGNQGATAQGDHRRAGRRH